MDKAGFRRWPWLLAALVAAGAARADVVTFSTGDFVAGEWTTLIWPGSSGIPTSGTAASGGNPGAYREVGLALQPGQSILNEQVWTGVSFDPSVRGQITAVSLSYDVTRIATDNPAAVQIVKGLAVRQQGIDFLAYAGASVSAAPAWEHLEVADLMAQMPAVNWSSGGPIMFGFYDAATATSQGFDIVGGYDNFSVTITFTPKPASSVPVPGALGLLCAGLGVLWRGRRRTAVS